MKSKDRSMKVSGKTIDKIKVQAKQERRTIKATLEMAVDYYIGAPIR